MAAATKRNPTVLLTFLCVIMKGFGDQGFLTREAASEEFHHQPHRVASFTANSIQLQMLKLEHMQ